METLTSFERVRKRPGMYIGGDDGVAIMSMVLEVVANAHDQYLAGRCTRVAISVESDGTIGVEDDGPGFVIEGSATVPPLVTVLTQHFDRPIVAGHHPHAHLGHGGIGLFVVNSLSERFEIVTVRDGVEARAVYARGEAVESITTAPSARPSGTRIRFRPDRFVFEHARVTRSALSAKLEDLAFLAPGLQLSWSFEREALTTHGLAGWVAGRAGVAFDRVAHHRERFATEHGPIEVEVALVWQPCGRARSMCVDSFVNLQRTREHGCHVEGLVDALVDFVAWPRDHIEYAGFTAAVAVVLSDVIYGDPRRDRLDSPHARAPVAAATKTALARWAEAQPALAAEARAQRI